MVSKFYSEMNKVENHLKITWNKERVNTSQSTRVEACNLGYGLRIGLERFVYDEYRELFHQISVVNKKKTVGD